MDFIKNLLFRKKKEEEKAEGAEVKDEQKTEEKPANGTGTVKKDDEPSIIASVVEAVAPKVDVTVTETPKVEETPKAEETPAVVVKVEENKNEEETKQEEVVADKEEESMTDKIEALADSIGKMEVKEVAEEVAESAKEKVDSMKSSMKETMDQISSNVETLTNGSSEMNGHKEVEAAE